MTWILTCLSVSKIQGQKSKGIFFWPGFWCVCRCWRDILRQHRQTRQNPGQKSKGIGGQQGPTKASRGLLRSYSWITNLQILNTIIIVVKFRYLRKPLFWNYLVTSKQKCYCGLLIIFELYMIYRHMQKSFTCFSQIIYTAKPITP